MVTINPYCSLPIYGNDYIAMYKSKSREDTKPHIFAVTDLAFRHMLEERENQSILVTYVPLNRPAIPRVAVLTFSAVVSPVPVKQKTPRKLSST